MTLGIAVLGTGGIVETAYVPMTARVDGAEIVAVLSRDGARGEDFARRHGIARAYRDLGALLGDPAVDAVVVATPDALHEAQVIAAAKAGKHILCEKPMTTTAASAERMAEAVRAAGVIFAMGFTYRFNPGLELIKAIMDRGEIGPVRYARAFTSTVAPDPDNWRGRGTLAPYWAMSATGTHLIDVLRWYFGDPAAIGGALASPVHNRANDEIAIVAFNYPGRLIAELACSVVVPGANRLEIHGETGSLVGEEVFGRSSRKAFITHRGERQTVEQDNPFVAEIADFVAAIATGRAPRATLEDGVRNMHIMEAVRTGELLKPLS